MTGSVVGSLTTSTAVGGRLSGAPGRTVAKEAPWLSVTRAHTQNGPPVRLPGTISLSLVVTVGWNVAPVAVDATIGKSSAFAGQVTEATPHSSVNDSGSWSGSSF